ncbi:MAG: ROK family transcriptional regulator [Nakamurella sp.]
MTGRAESFPTLSEASRAALVRLLVHGPASRADLARQLRMSAASLTRIGRSLEDSGLMVEVDTAVPQKMGRPSQAMDVNVDAAHFIGIKLLPGEINLVRTDMRSTVLGHRTIALPTQPVEAAIDQIATAVLAEVAVDPLVATVGISLAGPVDPQSQVVTQSPFLGWQNIPIGKIIQERTGLPTVIENDVRALTAAEHWFGAAAGATNFALVTIGAGIGCGVVIDDRLVDGNIGGAGHIGHLPVTASGPLCERGHRGCARSYLSSSAMVGQAAMALHRPDLTYDELVSLAKLQDRVASRVLHDAGYALGTLIGLITAITAPSKVIISGEGVTMVPLVMDVVEQRAREIEHWALPQVPIEIAPFGFLEWARGAAVIALQHLLESSIGPS